MNCDSDGSNKLWFMYARLDESNLEEMKSYGFLLTVLSRQTVAGLYFDYRNILD